MLYFVIEHSADRDPRPVYLRFAERGRLAPEGLEYRWVTADLARCYQVMECDDRALLEEWEDLVRFEVIEVVGSAEAAKAVARLDRPG